MQRTFNRREMVGAGFALSGLAAAQAPVADLPRLGVIARVNGQTPPDQAIAKVHAFGLPTCQVSVGPAPDIHMAHFLRAALDKYQVQATAIMTLGPGPMVWDFYSGPLTIGIVPAATRASRVDALKRASDLAKMANVPAVHTHCGFIPEDPNAPLYAEAVDAVREVANYCKANGQIFLMETGQETPITLLRVITDAGTGNVKVNLDTANLILYGKGEPLGALDVLGQHVRGVHAKDGMYPTEPKKLGLEVAIGQGRVNFPAVIKALKGLGYTGPITIERETSGAQQEEDIRRSKLFLGKLIADGYKRDS